MYQKKAKCPLYKHAKYHFHKFFVLGSLSILRQGSSAFDFLNITTQYTIQSLCNMVYSVHIVHYATLGVLIVTRSQSGNRSRKAHTLNVGVRRLFWLFWTKIVYCLHSSTKTEKLWCILKELEICGKMSSHMILTPNFKMAD